jgi:hypothetical protein
MLKPKYTTLVVCFDEITFKTKFINNDYYAFFYNRLKRCYYVCIKAINSRGC